MGEWMYRSTFYMIGYIMKLLVISFYVLHPVVYRFSGSYTIIQHVDSIIY
jgi:hypothetical protein